MERNRTRWLLFVLLALVLVGGGSVLLLVLGQRSEETGFDPKAGGTVLAVARVDQEPEILAVAPGDLAPPPAGVQARDLALLAVGPQGRQARPRQALAVFDRPLVPLTDLDSANAVVPLACDAPGSARWAGTSTAVWVPEGQRFPLASQVTCTIPAGPVGTTGGHLDDAVTFAFETERPGVEATWPRADEDAWDPDEPLLVVFNQPVDAAVVADALRLRPERGEAVALRGRHPAEDDDDWRLPGERSRAVLLDADLRRDTGYTLVVPAGVPGREGTLGTEAEHRVAFRTIPPPRVTAHQPEGQGVDPYSVLSLQLATETDASELNPRIRITPEPPDGFEPAGQFTSRWWSHGLRLAPQTTYTVTVEPGATDLYGQAYGEATSWTFTTGHHEPELDMATGVQVLPSTGEQTFPVRTRNLEQLYAAAQPVSLEWALARMESWKTFRSEGARLTTTAPLDLSGEVAVDDRSRGHALDLSPALQAGTGLVLVEAWSPQVRDWRGRVEVHRALVQASDLGITLKTGGGGATAWVTRLSDGRPVRGAEVVLYRGAEPAWRGTTDSEGMAVARGVLPEGWDPWQDPVHMVATKGTERSVTGASGTHALPTWMHGIWTSDAGTSGALRVHAYTERGVYRPGDTVHVGLTARLAVAEGLVLPPGGTVRWTCDDARDSRLGEGETSLGDHGEAVFDLALPPALALGEARCHVAVEAGKRQGEAYLPVPVHAYRRPAFRVEVSTVDHLVAGDTLRATAHGRFLFGAPMAGAEAEWAILSEEVDPAPEGWDAFVFGRREAAWWVEEFHPQERVASGEASLDGEGKLVFSTEVPRTEAPTTRRFLVEASVTDVARQRIANRAAVLVHPASVYPGVRPASGVGQVGHPADLEVVAVSPEGQVVPGTPLEIQVLRRTWDTIRQKGMDGRWTWVNTQDDAEVFRASAASATDPERVTWTPEQGGFHVVRVTARDRAGRTAVSEVGLYVAGAGASWARTDDNRVELVPDRREYAPGDTARILVQAPRPGLSALVTVEREGVLARRVVTLESTAETIEIPLGDDAVPNVFVSAVLVEPAPPEGSPEGRVSSWYLGYRELVVSPAGRRLAVEIRTDEASYGPGDEVEARVAVTREGRPAPGAHVVLWAVDHGVLSLTGYQVPDPNGTYYARRDLRVLTADTRTRILDRSAYLAKGAPTGGGGGISPRTRFETTPLWRPGLETGPDGTATVKFRLPDDLTTFRLMAVVDEGAEAFGAGEHEIRVTRPLLVRPALPRLLRQGDVTLAGVVVHNNRPEDRDVTVEASATGVALAGGSQTVTVPTGGAREVTFRITADEPGPARFHFAVSTDEDQDALEVGLEVVPTVPSETVATAGVVEGEAREAVARPEGARPRVGGLAVEVSPTVLVGADEALGYLLEYPWDCLEQTSSRLLAALLARRMGRAEVAGMDAEALDRLVQATAARLPDYRHPSGGYTTWPDGWLPAPEGTAYAMEALARAGSPPDREVLSFLREVMAGQWLLDWWAPATRRSVQARVALALARVGQGDPGFNAGLYEDRAQLSAAARARLLEALVRTTGHDRRTADLLEGLAGTVSVEAATAQVREPDPDIEPWTNELTATAATVAALLEARPDHPLLPRLARGLVATRRSGAWGNTYTTQAALSALHAYAERFEAGTAPRADVRLGGRTLLDRTLDRPEAVAATVPMAENPFGELVFRTDGARAYYEARLSYAPERVVPRDAGFTLVRRHELVQGTASPGTGVTAGALVKVTLRVVTPVDRTDVVVVDPLPAGLEPVDAFLATTSRAELAALDEEAEDLEDAPEDEEDDGTPWDPARVFNHVELGDASVTLHADWMPAGIHVYTYLARATTPGRYTLPAARVEEMYHPEVFGRTGQDLFVVGAGAVARAE